MTRTLTQVPTRPHVVPRHEWRADESLRFDGGGAEIWPRDTHAARRITLHHTKTPNGELDSPARLRGIYRFHAVDRGWGDIGYHLLVDDAGTVYEGRAGAADLVDGGRVVIAGHAYGHNAGNIGIALLGTMFEHPPSPRAWSTTVRLVAWLSHLHHLDPLALAAPDHVDPVVGHRDLRGTTCPGDAFYALLPALRAEVAAMTGAAARVAATAR